MSLFTILGLVIVSWALLSMVGTERQRLLEQIPKDEDEPAGEEKAPAGAAPGANSVVNSVKKP